MSKKGQLTAKQQAFIAHYFGEGGFNATKAAALAGYKANGRTLGAMAAENLQKPEIRECIQAEFKARGMCVDEVLGRLSETARGSIADLGYIDPNTGHFVLDLREAERNGRLHIIESLRYDKYGRPQLKLQSRLDALDKMARALKIFGDPVIDLRDLSDDQVLRLMERAAEKKRAQLQRNHELLSITDSPEPSEVEEDTETRSRKRQTGTNDGGTIDTNGTE